jgi:MoxR-like ATPase
MTMISPEQLSSAQATALRIEAGLNQRLLGQSALVRLLVVACLARGHVLLEGLPGLGKTELVKGLAGLLGLRFRRIQFTPDLLPSDITGSPVLEEKDGRREMVFRPGPVFGNLVLADEINRASPRTQAAMLEAMQEQCVTVLGESHPLPSPFWTLATQNPVDMEGTYPLPEAQMDRFLFKLHVLMVDEGVLKEIITHRRRGRAPEALPCLNEEEREQLFSAVDGIFLPEAVAGYIARLVDASHPSSRHAPASIRSFVRYGASPRAAIAIAEAARAHALISGKPNAGFDDVEAVAPHALGHRIALDYRAGLEGHSRASMASDLIQSVAKLSEEVPGTLRNG